jgi:dihydrolipoamide dehydrogenase
MADFDKLIVAIGRVPNTASLGAQTVGLKIDARGFVEVDERNRTNLPNVFAIGDVVRGPMLAHKSSEEGVVAAETIAGETVRHLDTILVITSPEIAWVGRRSSSSRPKAHRTALASSPSSPADGRAPWARPRASSRCSRTPRPIAFWGYMRSAPMPRS